MALVHFKYIKNTLVLQWANAADLLDPKDLPGLYPTILSTRKPPWPFFYFQPPAVTFPDSVHTITAPSMDEDLLVSASSPHGKKDPDDEVREIVNSLIPSTYLNPAVEKFLQDPGQKQLFLETFARQIDLIKSRNQSFENGHITIYDKVLLRLTDNGNSLGSVAAQEYFCEEYLGLGKNGDPEVAQKILDQNVALKVILARGKDPA